MGVGEEKQHAFVLSQNEVFGSLQMEGKATSPNPTYYAD